MERSGTPVAHVLSLRSQGWAARPLAEDSRPKSGAPDRSASEATPVLRSETSPCEYYGGRPLSSLTDRPAGTALSVLGASVRRVDVGQLERGIRKRTEASGMLPAPSSSTSPTS